MYHIILTIVTLFVKDSDHVVSSRYDIIPTIRYNFLSYNVLKQVTNLEIEVSSVALVLT